MVCSRSITLGSRRRVRGTMHGVKCVKTAIRLSGGAEGGGLGLTCHVRTKRPCGMHRIICSVSSLIVDSCVQRSSTRDLLTPNVLFSIGILSTRQRQVAGLLRGGNCCGFGGSFLICRTSATEGACLISLALELLPCRHEGRSLPRGRERCGIKRIGFLTSSRVVSMRRNALRRFSSLQCGKCDVCCGKGTFLHPRILISFGHVHPKRLCDRRSIRGACSGLKHLHTLGCSGVHFHRIGKRGNARLSTCMFLTGGGGGSVTFRMRKAGSTNSLKTTTSISFRRHGMFGNSRAFVVGIHNTCRTVAKLKITSRSCIGSGCVRCKMRDDLGFPRFVFPFLSSGFGGGVETASRINLGFASRIHPRFSHALTSTS